MVDNALMVPWIVGSVDPPGRPKGAATAGPTVDCILGLWPIPTNFTNTREYRGTTTPMGRIS